MHWLALDGRGDIAIAEIEPVEPSLDNTERIHQATVEHLQPSHNHFGLGLSTADAALLGIHLLVASLVANKKVGERPGKLGDRKALIHDVDIRESGPLQQAVQLRFLVTAHMTDQFIGFAVLALVCRNGYQQFPFGLEIPRPFRKRIGIVLDVFKHFERKQVIERFLFKFIEALDNPNGQAMIGQVRASHSAAVLTKIVTSAMEPPLKEDACHAAGAGTHLDEG